MRYVCSLNVQYIDMFLMVVIFRLRSSYSTRMMHNITRTIIQSLVMEFVQCINNFCPLLSWGTPSFARVPLLTKMVVFIIRDYDMKTCILNFLSLRVHIWNLATIRKNNDPSRVWTHMLEMGKPLFFGFYYTYFWWRNLIYSKAL